jgi:hypothetical protein
MSREKSRRRCRPQIAAASIRIEEPTFSANFSFLSDFETEGFMGRGDRSPKYISKGGR